MSWGVPWSEFQQVSSRPSKRNCLPNSLTFRFSTELTLNERKSFGTKNSAISQNKTVFFHSKYTFCLLSMICVFLFDTRCSSICSWSCSNRPPSRTSQWRGRPAGGSTSGHKFSVEKNVESLLNFFFLSIWKFKILSKKFSLKFLDCELL